MRYDKYYVVVLLFILIILVENTESKKNIFKKGYGAVKKAFKSGTGHFKAGFNKFKGAFGKFDPSKIFKKISQVSRKISKLPRNLSNSVSKHLKRLKFPLPKPFNQIMNVSKKVNFNVLKLNYKGLVGPLNKLKKHHSLIKSLNKINLDIFSHLLRDSMNILVRNQPKINKKLISNFLKTIPKLLNCAKVKESDIDDFLKYKNEFTAKAYCIFKTLIDFYDDNFENTKVDLMWKDFKEYITQYKEFKHYLESDECTEETESGFKIASQLHSNVAQSLSTMIIQMQFVVKIINEMIGFVFDFLKAKVQIPDILGLNPGTIMVKTEFPKDLINEVIDIVFDIIQSNLESKSDDVKLKRMMYCHNKGKFGFVVNL